MKLLADINKFSIAQLLSNSNGKTSASGTAGMLLVLTGILGFLASIVAVFLTMTGCELMMICSLVVIATATGLLGYRKSLKVNGMEFSDQNGSDTSTTQPTPDVSTVSPVSGSIA